MAAYNTLPSFFFVILALTLVDHTKIFMVSSETVVPSKNCYCLTEIASSLYNPVMASFVERNGKLQIIVAEQRGVIKLLSDGLTTPILDLQQKVVSSNDYGDQRGLLSAVPSPDFKTDGKIYVAYTRQENGKEYTYVSEFIARGNEIYQDSERFLLRVFQPFEQGNGGPMFFGDDGYLYIVTGDGGAEDDALGNAQNKGSLHGSVLRVDVKAGQTFNEGESGMARAYKIPDDNPFVNDTGALAEIYANGFRNMWGCSQDSKSMGGDGRIYCAETGTSYFDEINVIEKGKNYGWNIKEGTMCINSTKSTCPTIENEALPVYVFAHSGQHALVGGYVYRGSDFNFLKKTGQTNYVFGDVITGKVRILEENSAPENWTASEWPICSVSDCPSNAKGRPLKHILAFSQDKNGELYLSMVDALTALTPTGKMFQMKPASSAPSGLVASNNLNIVLAAFVTLCIICRSTF